MLTAGNAAYDSLLQDYVRFHEALVVVGGVFTLALTALGIFAWVRFRRAPRPAQGGLGFEKRTYLLCGVFSLGLSALLALVVAANLSNVLNPRAGLDGAIGNVAYPRALASWLDSGSPEVPAFIQERVEERLAWQMPKAIISTILLLLCAALTVYLWRRLMMRYRAHREVRGRGLVLSAASFGILACFVLMLMVMGNTQASYAPVVMTLLYG